ncbi:translation initiation factor IF-2-like [Lemur catta]|uniref:translation initiation factor IF-2-like n=1 Tax=Lemur catta TaxID=9447 RepID=UPI001E26A54C|nr:translation initiation factor IF-2-like [Lemur catta]
MWWSPGSATLLPALAACPLTLPLGSTRLVASRPSQARPGTPSWPSPILCGTWGPRCWQEARAGWWWGPWGGGCSPKALTCPPSLLLACSLGPQPPLAGPTGVPTMVATRSLGGWAVPEGPLLQGLRAELARQRPAWEGGHREVRGRQQWGRLGSQAGLPKSRGRQTRPRVGTQESGAGLEGGRARPCADGKSHPSWPGSSPPPGQGQRETVVPGRHRRSGDPAAHTRPGVCLPVLCSLASVSLPKVEVLFLKSSRSQRLPQADSAAPGVGQGPHARCPGTCRAPCPPSQPPGAWAGPRLLGAQPPPANWGAAWWLRDSPTGRRAQCQP